MNKIRCLIFCLVLAFTGCSSLLALAENQPDLEGNNISKSITSKTLDIGWFDDWPEPVRWRVLTADQADPPQWFSLQVPGQGNELLTRHLRLQGQIAGQKLSSTGQWQDSGSKQTSGKLIFQQVLGDSDLLLERVYQATGELYRLSFKIILQNKTSKVFEPQAGDHLLLSLGPGLGNQQVEGLGYAESIYSFVETVGLLNSEVQSFRPQSAVSVIMPWNGPDLEWVGLHGRYFALLLAPVADQLEKNGFGSQPVQTYLAEHTTLGIKPEFLSVISVSLPIRSIAPGKVLQWQFMVFAGPKSLKALRMGTPRFDELMFPSLWRWMRWLSFGLLYALETIHVVVPSWGVAILLLAALVRLIMYPLAKSALVRQKEFVEAQKRMQPELQIIKREYAGGEQSERILQLYEQYDVSPLAGLKPLLIVLIQLPILVSLFHVLGSAYELHDAKFLWINTLAEPDKLFDLGFSIPLLGEYFNVLPVFMALSTLAVLKLSPAPAADPVAQRRQNIFLVIMALIFFILFYPFPSGMVLYWTAANLLQIFQQKFFGSVNFPVIAADHEES